MTTWLSLALAVLMALSIPAMAQEDIPGTPGQRGRGDNPKHPLGAKRFELRQRALQERLNGRGTGRVHELAKGQFVELQQERSDRIFVVIVEFGTAINPVTGGTPGPVHNQIPEPDRAVNNTTIWQPDYNRAHYENIYFSDRPGAIRC